MTLAQESELVVVIPFAPLTSLVAPLITARPAFFVNDKMT